MIYYKKGERIETLDSENGYFMPNSTLFAMSLMYNNASSTEESVIKWLKNRYSPMNYGTFVDVGANVGTYTIELGSIYRHVCSFEPCKHIYNILCGNVALRDLSDRCDLYNVALSDKEEAVTYKDYDILGGNNMCVKGDGDISSELCKMYDYCDPMARTTEITTRTLDSYGLDDVSLMKIDVEGFELNVLKGASETIIRSKYPLILVESWEVQETDEKGVREAKIKLREDLFNYLRDILGYHIENLYNDIFVCSR